MMTPSEWTFMNAAMSSEQRREFVNRDGASVDARQAIEARCQAARADVDEAFFKQREEQVKALYAIAHELTKIRERVSPGRISPSADPSNYFRREDGTLEYLPKAEVHLMEHTMDRVIEPKQGEDRVMVFLMDDEKIVSATLLSLPDREPVPNFIGILARLGIQYLQRFPKARYEFHSLTAG